MATLAIFSVPVEDWDLNELRQLVGKSIRLDIGSEIVEDAGKLHTVAIDDSDPDCYAVSLEVWGTWLTDIAMRGFADIEWTILGESMAQEMLGVPMVDQKPIWYCGNSKRYTEDQCDESIYVGDVLGYDDLDLIDCDQKLAARLWQLRTLFDKEVDSPAEGE